MAMSPDYKPAAGAKRHLAGTPPVAGNALMEAALDLWRDIDPAAAFAKHAALGEFLIRLVEAQTPELTLASPRDFARRGGFVSFRHRDASAFAEALEGAKVVASYRAPDVVRFGLSPLYHRYADIWALGERLRQLETVRT
jgi:kynureninase